MSAAPLKVFVDLDGVLADFNGRRDQVLDGATGGLNQRGLPVSEELREQKQRLYAYLRRHPEFFEQLEPLPTVSDLWPHLQPHDPTILTAVPSAFEPGSQAFRSAADAKYRWCQQHLGVERDDFEATTSDGKLEYVRELRQRRTPRIDASGNGHERDLEDESIVVPVLIDDRMENCQDWTNAGGWAILHRETPTTLTRFRTLVQAARRARLPDEFPRGGRARSQ